MTSGLPPRGVTARQIAEAFAVSPTDDPTAYNAAAVVAELVDAALAHDDALLLRMMPSPTDPRLLGAVISLLVRLVAAHEAPQ